MKIKNRLICLFTCLATIASVFPFASCGSDQTSDSKVMVFNGYESYEDLNATSIRGWAQGSIKLNTDKQYVTEGEKSAYFALAQSNGTEGYQGAQREYPWVSFFKYETRVNTSIRWLDKIENFSFDIYNVDNKDYKIYFSAIGDSGHIYNSNGATLVANSWNMISFDMKPWFYEEDTYVKEYVFYIVGIEETAHFYMDNVCVTKYDGIAPTYNKEIDEMFEEQELLPFDCKEDLQFVQTECGKGGDTGEIIRLMDVSYVPNIKVGNRYGGMRVDFDRCLLNGWGWSKVTAHTLRIDPHILTNAQNVKSFEIQCFNPNARAHIVTLEILSGERTVSKRVRITPLESTTIAVTNLLSLDTIENIYIRIDGWDVTSLQTLYFSGLNFTI